MLVFPEKISKTPAMTQVKSHTPQRKNPQFFLWHYSPHRPNSVESFSEMKTAIPVTQPLSSTLANWVLKPLIFSEKMQLKTPKSSSKSNKFNSRRSLSLMFDPELVSLFERELHEESEQTKRILLTTTKNLKEEVRDFLRSFEEKCPHGGEKVAVLYTTTLRGIRKTFDECNMVRSVKGRMVGGAAEVMRPEEEGILGLLLGGKPKTVRSCEDCGGLRFVMCKVYNGSCKVLVQGKKKITKCGECNENGLVHCASCNKLADDFPSVLT